DEAGNVVHVAVRIVAGDAGTEPDHFLDSQIIGEGFFVVFALHARVALLNFAQKTLFSRQKSSLAVHVDGTAFEDHAVFAERGAERGMDFFYASGGRHEAADFFFLSPFRSLGSRIEIPLDGL